GKEVARSPLRRTPDDGWHGPLAAPSDRFVRYYAIASYGGHRVRSATYRLTYLDRTIDRRVSLSSFRAARVFSLAFGRPGGAGVRADGANASLVTEGPDVYVREPAQGMKEPLMRQGTFVAPSARTANGPDANATVDGDALLVGIGATGIRLDLGKPVLDVI